MSKNSKFFILLQIFKKFQKSNFQGPTESWETAACFRFHLQILLTYILFGGVLWYKNAVFADFRAGTVINGH